LWPVPDRISEAPLEFAQAGRVPAPGDNVAIAIRTLPAGTRILLRQLVFEFAHTVLEGHRFAVFRIGKGEPLLSWGLPFGLALRDIEPGEYVCNEKILRVLGERRVDFKLPKTPNFLDYRLPYQFNEAAFAPGKQVHYEGESPTFKGYQRGSPRGAGTRNYIVVIGTSARTGALARNVAARFRNGLREFKNIDGVVPVDHTEGGSESVPHNLDLTLRTLAGFMVNPNVGAVLCLDYGNEVVSNQALARYLKEHDYPTGDLFHQFASVGSSYENTRQAAEKVIEEWQPRVNAFKRETLPIRFLNIGLQCGGSDAFSGVSANPLAGLLARDLVAWHGSANLAETDELIGAESYILQNVRDAQTAKAFLEKIERFQAWAAMHGHSAEGNPSGGNMYRGLYNITIKSIGAARKKDPATRLDHVIDFSERMEQPGFHFMDSPGNDLESIAGQVAAGCNMIVFATGNGSITNFPFVPTIKLMTTTGRFELVRNEMDFNAGRYQDSETLENLRKEAFELLRRVASGEKSAGEKAGHAQVQLWREWRGSTPHPGPLPSEGRGKRAPFVPLNGAPGWKGFLPSSLKRVRGGTALVLPTSLCSGQIAQIIVERLNSAGITPAVALPHTEGCGNSAGESEELFMRTMAGYLAHPLVGRALLLEHGCEKTHNDAFRRVVRELELPEENFGWASVQLDGGIDRVINKAVAWFKTKNCAAQQGPSGIAFAGSDLPKELPCALQRIAAGVVREGGFVVIPEAMALFEEELPKPTISYGERALASGVHRMECPTDDLVETITGLAATGAQVIAVWENRNLVPSNPLVPTIQIARRGLMPRHLEGDVDLLLDRNPEKLESSLVKLLQEALAGKLTPRNRMLGNSAFQITRGYTGISL
jgi:altronate dehydratase